MQSGSPRVLVITNKQDLTSDVVILELYRRDIPFLRLNTEDLYREITPTISLSDVGISVRLDYPAEQINLEKVQSIWYRRPAVTPVSSDVKDKGVAQFIRKERREFLDMAWAALERCFWVSYPSCICRAENKFLQLRVAQKIGFKIPNTIITSSPSDAREFLNQCVEKKGIAKAVSSGDVSIDGKDYIVYTNEICPDEISDNGELEICPCVFQEKIIKKVDIRVIVIGNKCFAVEIYAKGDFQNGIDWRMALGKDDIDYKIHKLSQGISYKCQTLVNNFGLQFSSMDLALDKNGNYYFLDLNPNGQWTWFDEELPLNSVGAMCDLLAKGSSQ